MSCRMVGLYLIALLSTAILPMFAARATPIGWLTGEDSPVKQVDEGLIKEAQLQLLVSDTAAALEQIEQFTLHFGGRIALRQTWTSSQAGTKRLYATLILRIPSQSFEQALVSLRGMAVEVLDESISGEDVSERIADLQATQRWLFIQRERLTGLRGQAQSEGEKWLRA